MKPVTPVMLALLVTTSCFISPSCLADILICDNSDGSVLRYDDSGNFVDFFVPANPGILTNPTAIEFGPDGLVYIADSSNDAVFTYTYPTGNFAGNFIDSSNISFIKDIAFGPDGDLYVLDDIRIKQFDGNGGALVRTISLDFASATRFRFEENTGDIIIGAPSEVWRVHIDYKQQANDEIVWNVRMSAGGFDFGPGKGADGDMYVHVEGSTDQIQRYDLATGDFVDTFTAKAPEAGSHIEFMSNGNLLVADDNPVSDIFSISIVNGTTGVVEGNLIDDLPSTAIDFEFVPNSFSLNSFLVTNGVLVSGGLPELAASDNLDVSARRLSSDVQSRVFAEFESTSPNDSPSSLALKFEAAVFARSGVTQSIDLFDYDSASWEQVDSRPASPNFDSVVYAPATNNLSRFVEPVTRTIKARCRFQSASQRQRFAANIDHVFWLIGP